MLDKNGKEIGINTIVEMYGNFAVVDDINEDTGKVRIDDGNGLVEYVKAADMLTVVDFEVPSIPNIHKTVYAAASRPGALEMGDWHTCQNTHCWGGWAVYLAGDAGWELEGMLNTGLAAQLIYEKSGYADIDYNWFYDLTNPEALAKMKELAETT